MTLDFVDGNPDGVDIAPLTVPNKAIHGRGGPKSAVFAGFGATGEPQAASAAIIASLANF